MYLQSDLAAEDFAKVHPLRQLQHGRHEPLIQLQVVQISPSIQDVQVYLIH